MTLQNGAKVIAFDFDGVLHEYHGWNEGRLGPPIAGMLEMVRTLRQRGAHVVVHTTREREAVQRWLADGGFPPLDVYHEKWQRIDVFVDDRAINFEPEMATNRDFVEQLLAFQPYWRRAEETR